MSNRADQQEQSRADYLHRLNPPPSNSPRLSKPHYQ
jgi:hypothetical protein